MHEGMSSIRLESNCFSFSLLLLVIEDYMLETSLSTYEETKSKVRIGSSGRAHIFSPPIEENVLKRLSEARTTEIIV